MSYISQDLPSFVAHLLVALSQYLEYMSEIPLNTMSLLSMMNLLALN